MWDPLTQPGAFLSRNPHPTSKRREKSGKLTGRQAHASGARRRILAELRVLIRSQPRQLPRVSVSGGWQTATAPYQGANEIAYLFEEG